MHLNQKDWSCPKKQKARWETIISQYQKHFQQTLPENKQYWTLCGQCATQDGEQLQGCEIWQLVESNLIKANQFRGVEIDEEIYNINQKAFPEIQWHHDDFYNAMLKVQSNKTFNPAIVNIDLPKTPDGGCHYTSKILSFLSDCCDELLVVVNLILRKSFYTTKDGDYVIDQLNKFPQFRYAMKKGKWQLSDLYYTYNGAGETGSRTGMGSFIFIKTK